MNSAGSITPENIKNRQKLTFCTSLKTSIQEKTQETKCGRPSNSFNIGPGVHFDCSYTRCTVHCEEPGHQLRGRNENRFFKHLSMKYQFSVKTKDNENCIFTESVKTKDNENSTEHGAVKTVKSDISTKYQISDKSFIIFLFSIYPLSLFG